MSNIILSAQSSNNEVKSYFNSVLTLTKSGEKFPVDLDEVWPLCYVQKVKAVQFLTDSGQFYEGEDYILLSQKGKQTEAGSGGHNRQVYMLSVHCMEYLIARKNKKVFDIYKDVFDEIITIDLLINNEIHRNVRVIYKNENDKIGVFMAFIENDDIFFYYKKRDLLVSFSEWLEIAKDCENPDKGLMFVNTAVEICGSHAAKYISEILLTGFFIHTKIKFASEITGITKTYLMIDGNNGYIKIGKSKNPKVREKTLQSEKPNIKLLYVSDKNIEKILHSKYSCSRVRGEWFRLTDDEISFIIKEYNFKPCHENC